VSIKAIARVQLIHLINAERRRAAADPQTMPTDRGVYGGGEVDATCVQFGSGGRIPPSRGEEFPQIYGSYIIYKSFLAQRSHLQLGVHTSLIFVVSYITARCTLT